MMQIMLRKACTCTPILHFQLAAMSMVRHNASETTICAATSPENAAWIAKRLNLASDLERLTVELATGKSDGVELVEYVQRMMKL